MDKVKILIPDNGGFMQIETTWFRIVTGRGTIELVTNGDGEGVIIRGVKDGPMPYQCPGMKILPDTAFSFEILPPPPERRKEG
jgi:hypothetical protein